MVNENVTPVLSSLYGGYGYTQYKMSKFEEYDLYVKNKDFLVSENIITFTDTNGKLMALKPDVTLSIIKNTPDTPVLKKLYYNENVYRISKGTGSYSEIMQTGLECIGTIDNYSVFEVITLAAKSLGAISDDFILTISHLDIIKEVLSSLSLEKNDEYKILKCISEKNIHEITKICDDCGADSAVLKEILSVYGNIPSALEKLSKIELLKNSNSFASFSVIANELAKSEFSDKIVIDFSVTSDVKYYNGFVFKGFINGISESVLSGGQYDGLMKKMGKSSGAIGFAVYTDLLLNLSKSSPYDIDTLLLYDDSLAVGDIKKAAQMLASGGKSVMTQSKIPDKLKFRILAKITDKGVEIIENNA